MAPLPPLRQGAASLPAEQTGPRQPHTSRACCCCRRPFYDDERVTLLLDAPGARTLLERELGNLPLAVRVLARLLHLRAGSKPDDAVLCNALASPQPGHPERPRARQVEQGCAGCAPL